MSIELPALFTAFIRAKNNHDSRALAALFSEDGEVDDEDRVHVGRAAIEVWANEANEKYQLAVEPTGLIENDAESVLSALVSGNFDGSPIEFRFHMRIADGKIAHLRAEA